MRKKIQFDNDKTHNFFMGTDFLFTYAYKYLTYNVNLINLFKFVIFTYQFDEKH